MHSQQGEMPQAILQAWGLAEPPGRGPAARFTVTQVVAEAVDLADAQGIEQVTLSALARRMGLVTTALYRYVDSKATLDELVRDAALGQAPELQEATARNAAIAWCDSLWERYEAHPWLASTPPVRAPRCPNAYAWLDALVSRVTATGLSNAAGLAVSLDTLVRGLAQQDTVQDTTPNPVIWDEIARRHPHLADSMANGVDPHSQLVLMVDKILDGR